MLFDNKHVTMGPKLAKLSNFRVFRDLGLCIGVVQMTCVGPPLKSQADTQHVTVGPKLAKLVN